MFAHKKSSR